MKKTRLFQDGFVFAAIAGVIFIGAVLREVNLLLLLASLLTCFLVFDYWIGKLTLRRLRLRRNVPSNVYAGESFLTTLELSNDRKSLSSWATVVEDRIEPLRSRTATDDRSILTLGDDLSKAKRKNRRFWAKSTPTDDSSPVYRPVCFFEQVRPEKTQKGTYAGRLPERGRYRLGPTTVSTLFPFGFFRSSIVLGGEETFAVFPKIGRLKKNWFRRYQQLNERQNRSVRRASRTSDELLGIRSWQTGDIQKWIHWRASAKHQEILVRQFEERQNQQIAVIVDLFQNGETTLASVENVELAVSFAATLVREIVRASFSRLHFAVGGTSDVLSGKAGQSLSFSVMERLTDVRATSNDRLAETVQSVALATSADSTTLLITTAPLDWTSRRFDSLKTDPRLRHFLARIDVVDVSDPSFDDYFQFEKN